MKKFRSILSPLGALVTFAIGTLLFLSLLNFPVKWVSTASSLWNGIGILTGIVLIWYYVRFAWIWIFQSRMPK